VHATFDLGYNDVIICNDRMVGAHVPIARHSVHIWLSQTIMCLYVLVICFFKLLLKANFDVDALKAVLFQMSGKICLGSLAEKFVRGLSVLCFCSVE